MRRLSLPGGGESLAVAPVSPIRLQGLSVLMHVAGCLWPLPAKVIGGRWGSREEDSSGSGGPGFWNRRSSRWGWGTWLQFRGWFQVTV